MVRHDGPAQTPQAVFDLFLQAQSLEEVQSHHAELCRLLDLDTKDHKNFYSKLKARLNYWRADALLEKLDKRASHQDYQQGNVCPKNKCLVVGAGPCGLRTAIELSLLGAQVVVVEKRDTFCRNNVLHLWPYTISDLRGLGANKLYRKFCTGALDHISIRQLQLILLKICLVLGVELNTGLDFQGLNEPSENRGWTAKLHPASHPAASFQFDVFIAAGGSRALPDGFSHKETKGKLAIGITANFINQNTAAETRVPEISGVACIYNQQFFQNLRTKTGIDLENIVYYKDDTHYFVMTAKKGSLLQKGVIKRDRSDRAELLAAANVDQSALRRYAYDAARFSTTLPRLEFAPGVRGQADVFMFDFTSMYRAEYASLVRERRGRRLLIGLVGDSLVEPFWPLGSGIARGFFAAFDVAWMVRSWGLGDPPLKVLAERESLHQLLSQVTPDNISRKYGNYSINPSTRYQHVNLSSVNTSQVQNQYDAEKSRPKPLPIRQESCAGFDELLRWCQLNTAGYERVQVQDLTQSWTSGLALCALIHRFRPQLIDMSSLDESNGVHNNRLAFSILQREFGISPSLSASDVADRAQIDRLAMFQYLTQVHDALDVLVPSSPFSHSRLSAVFFISKLKHSVLKRRKTAPSIVPLPPVEPQTQPGGGCVLEVSSEGSSSECYSCTQKVYVLERISAEGKFFHRSCFKCHHCGVRLRLGGYTFHRWTGRFYCELHSAHTQLKAYTQVFQKALNTTDQDWRSESIQRQKGVETVEETSCSPPPPPLDPLQDNRPDSLQLNDTEISQLDNLQSLSLDSETVDVAEGCVGGDDDDDDDDDDDYDYDDDDDDEMYGRDNTESSDSLVQAVNSDPVEAQRMERKKVRTLERQSRASEMRRFHKAQSIQRRLEEIDASFKELEEKGVALEREMLQDSGNEAVRDHWVQLVHLKNKLTAEEKDLVVESKQLELEDRQSMLESMLKKSQELSDSEKTADHRAEEEELVQQRTEVMDMRGALVAFLKERD